MEDLVKEVVRDYCWIMRCGHLDTDYPHRKAEWWDCDRCDYGTYIKRPDPRTVL